MTLEMQRALLVTLLSPARWKQLHSSLNVTLYSHRACIIDTLIKVKFFLVCKLELFSFFVIIPQLNNIECTELPAHALDGMGSKLYFYLQFIAFFFHIIIVTIYIW